MSDLNIKRLYVAGMFRSGTTLIARMLGAHRNIACASDAFLPVYKAIRSRVETTVGMTSHNNDIDRPISDYYFDNQALDVYRGIKSIDLLSEPIKSKELEILKERISNYSLPYSPLLARRVGDLNGDTYGSLLISGYKLVQQVYGNDQTSVVATKEVWANEFGNCLLNSNLANQMIHVIRDPRAVISSNIASGQPYPLLFTLRHWRKLAGIAIMNAHKKNHMIIKYEDLVADKKFVSSNVCSYLDIEFDDSMIREDRFRDGAGNRWDRNSSYTKNNKTNLIAGTNDWEKILTKQQISYIEKYAYKEMKVLGYMRTSSEFPDRIGYQESDTQYAMWIREHSFYNWNEEEQKENHRLSLMKGDRTITESEVEYNFIDSDVYAMLNR